MLFAGSSGSRGAWLANVYDFCMSIWEIMLRMTTVGSFVLNFVVTFFLLLRLIRDWGKGLWFFCLLGCLSFVDIFSSPCFCLLIAVWIGYRTGSSVRASATGKLNSVVELSAMWFFNVSFCSFRDVRFAFLMFCMYQCLGAFARWNSGPVFICMRVYRQPIRVK